MDVLSNLAFGLGVALAPVNLLCALVGGLLGTLVGVLPGLSPVAAMAMLLPATYALSPVSTLILLAAVYHGAQYGRTIAAMWVQLPADAKALTVGSDANQMARQGRATFVLASSGLASFFAASVVTLVLVACAPALSYLAIPFGAVEIFALMVLALVGAAMLASGSRLKALAMVVLGMLLGLVGHDTGSGMARFAFGIPELADGIGLVALAMGVFGYGEVLGNLAQSAPARQVLAARLRGPWPTLQDLKDMAAAVIRGTALGTLLGLVPGGGARMSGFAALTLEKKVAAKPAEAALGTGNIRAVVAPESASQAGAQTSMLPLLSLGMPVNAVMVLLLGALGMHRLQPGPQLLGDQPELVWGLIASMWVGNLMVRLLNIPLIGVWSRLMRVPYRWLYPAVVLFCALGVYSVHNSISDIWLVAGFGCVGYVFSKLGMAPAPLLLGFVLGPAMEDKLQQALLLSQGDWSVFATHPLSAGLLLLALCMLVVLPAVRARHKQTFVEE